MDKESNKVSDTVQKARSPLLIAFPLIIIIIIFIVAMDSNSPTNDTEDLVIDDTITQQPETPTPPTQSPGDFDELTIETIESGDGKTVKSGNTIRVHYTGTLMDGTKFDSSVDRGEPFEFTYGEGQVIEGWEQGLVGMKVGGKRKLSIPSTLGYGESGAGTIPPKSGLIFEVELIEIVE